MFLHLTGIRVFHFMLKERTDEHIRNLIKLSTFCRLRLIGMNTHTGNRQQIKNLILALRARLPHLSVLIALPLREPVILPLLLRETLHRQRTARGSAAPIAGRSRG